MSVQDFSLSARIKAQICKDPVLQEEECDRLRIDLFRRIAGKPVARALRCHRLRQNFRTRTAAIWIFSSSSSMCSIAKLIRLSRCPSLLLRSSGREKMQSKR